MPRYGWDMTTSSLRNVYPVDPTGRPRIKHAQRVYVEAERALRAGTINVAMYQARRRNAMRILAAANFDLPKI